MQKHLKLSLVHTLDHKYHIIIIITIIIISIIIIIIINRYYLIRKVVENF